MRLKTRKSKIIAIIVAVCVVAIGLLLIRPIRSIIAMNGMEPLETGEIVPGVYAIKDTMVNMYLIKTGDEYIAIDAGMKEGTISNGLSELGINKANVTALILTHRHYDHTGGVGLFSSAREYTFDTDREVMVIGDVKIECIFTPGHTNNSVSFLVNEGHLFVGDNLRLTDGKVSLFNSVFNSSDEVQKTSITKLSKLNGVKMMFTAHYGYTADFEAAFSDWK